VASTVAGPTGIQGPAGPTGPIGPQGPIGLTGAQGIQGILGPQGPNGLTGATGVIGAQGIQGVIGLQGAVGSQGLQGPIGAQGIIGVTGPQGATGTVGLIGLQGPAGAAGANGVTGATGPTGPAGPQGPVGLNSTSNIGRYYGGGWIAAEWIEGSNPSNRRVLIVGTSLPSWYQWTLPAYQNVNTPGAVDYVRGDGNTAAITTQAGVGLYAAAECENVVQNGYSDWYLPSVGELNMIYNSLPQINRAKIASGLPAIPVQTYCWTSTQSPILISDALAFALSGGFQGFSFTSPKLDYLQALPVRTTSI
jgi:hypothetical protein